MTGPLESAEAIFLALADLSPHERVAFLENHCGRNSSLRAEVDSMLASLEAADEGFLDPTRVPALDMAAVDGPLQPGTALGSFLVLRAIGSGGMGVVYAAQQDTPRRTVASKSCAAGFDTLRCSSVSPAKRMFWVACNIPVSHRCWPFITAIGVCRRIS